MTALKCMNTRNISHQHVPSPQHKVIHRTLGIMTTDQPPAHLRMFGCLSLFMSCISLSMELLLERCLFIFSTSTRPDALCTTCKGGRKQRNNCWYNLLTMKRTISVDRGDICYILRCVEPEQFLNYHVITSQTDCDWALSGDFLGAVLIAALCLLMFCSAIMAAPKTFHTTITAPICQRNRRVRCQAAVPRLDNCHEGDKLL